jgi:hypothetical protein
MGQANAGAQQISSPWDTVATSLGVALISDPNIDGPEHVSPIDGIALYNTRRGGDPWMALAYLCLSRESDEPIAIGKATERANELRRSVL